MRARRPQNAAPTQRDPDSEAFTGVRYGCSGLTVAPQQHMHRNEHYEYLKKGNAVMKPQPKLPSDLNVEHTYGMPSTHIPLEVYRVAG